MTRSAAFISFIALVSVASPATSTPPPPPAPHTWIKIAWECPGRQRSFVEIERLAERESGYRTRVVGLMISGRKIDPETIAGLQEMVARRNFLRPVGGYCERGGEIVGIEELASGAKKAEAGWRRFYIPYAPQP